MSTTPTVPTPPRGPALPALVVAEELHRRAEERVERAGRADRTAAAYAADLDAFRVYLARVGRPVDGVTADDVVAYLELRLTMGAAASSLARYVAGIGSAYPTATKTDAVRRWMRDMRTRHPKGTAPSKRAPFSADQVRAVIAALDAEAKAGPVWGRLRALRDRALLLVGYTGAFRRSELAALVAGDLERTEVGVLVTLRRSKTDQAGAGMVRELARGTSPASCPVAALDAWFAAAPATDATTPVFRAVAPSGVVGTAALSDRAVHAVVRRCARLIGLEDARFGAHSLRRSFATNAAKRLPEVAWMRQGGWRSVTVARGYVAEAERWTVNFTAGVGL